ncbi:hypothetical protein DSM3645_03818 [Blastopirellula marina DSM 3645]|uniref:Uncharacterized protein n=1 Tax=Blastopirellula marina DSM 3645 TaxID=314230 RepID=A3ZW75_9BACT|nr:hypothetical protein DSM3645_03818 [Blastopirellula marina DSM 3645]
MAPGGGLDAILGGQVQRQIPVNTTHGYT